MDNMLKLVSIVIPVYNVEDYIEKCLISITSQTYKNLEIIIVNDGSKENEETIIKKYMEKDARLVYVKKDKNEGLYKARISGVKKASGDFIMFVDSDDYINKDFVRLLVKEAEDTDSDITFSRTVLCTPNGSYSRHVFQNAELYKLPLEKEALRQVFYGQHGMAFIWHTVWNKLYTKRVWDKSISILEQLDDHIVMTEDIAFSSIIYYFANKASCVKNANYFYCQHENASTNATGMTIEKYDKQFSDVSKVFTFVEAFFSDKESWIKDGISNFKEYYAQMWHRIGANVEVEDEEAIENIWKKMPIDENYTHTPLEEHYFPFMEIPYDTKFDEIKERIINGEEKIISFDVFDTAIVRPVYNPKDLQILLDKKYEEFCKSNTSFYTIRTQGEQGCRERLCNEEKEDVSLHEIYTYISDVYAISSYVANEIMQFEQEIEIEFANRRNSTFELYELAILSGKKVVFTSDMYLPRDTIEKMLNKCGYLEYDDIIVSSEYEKLKYTGNLYKVLLNKYDVESEFVLHIGDNYFGDIKAAEKMGIQTIYYPKALDAFCGKTENLRNQHRFQLGKSITGDYRGSKSFENNLAYGTMMSLAANFYFDNPFEGFNDITDFNVDAYFAGYYALGSNLIAQIGWIEKLLSDQIIERIVFTSRDGYLLMKAFEIYGSITNKDIPMKYLYVSRKSMLPWMINCVTDFQNLPIVIQKYSPELLDDLLDFCLKDDVTGWVEFLADNGYEYDYEFTSIEQYHKYIQLLLKHRYDQTKHNKAKEKVSKYLSDLKSTDGIFDLGYSGSIHKAMIDASGVNTKALFIHSDNDKHLYNSRRGDFNICTLMDTIPHISGLMREFFFSTVEEGSCIGYDDSTGDVMPILENEDKYYSDITPIVTMQMGALQMVRNFYEVFNGYMDYIEIRPNEMMLPFEGFISEPSKVDTKMFRSSWFEDKVYGRIERINVRDFWIQLLKVGPSNKSKDLTDDFEGFLKKHNKSRLAFFGTGRMSDAILYNNINIPVSLFLDNSKAKIGKKYRGVEICSPYDCGNIKELFIIVTIVAYKEVEEQLRDMGLTKYEDYVNYLEIF